MTQALDEEKMLENRNWSRSALLVMSYAFIVATGCQDAAEDDPVAPGVLKSVDAVKYVDGLKVVIIDGQEWLAADGPPVPPDVPIPAPPEPYDPVKHGPPAKNSMPEANLVLRPDFQPPPKEHQFHLSRDVREDDPKAVLAQRGRVSWTFRDLTYSDGIYSHAEVNLYFPMPAFYPSAFIYTSTEYPSDYACIEIAVVHGQGQDQMGFYNHCATPEDWLSLENMRANNWNGRYTRMDYTDRMMSAVVLRYPPGSDCWQGFLYNFNSSEYEEKTPLVCGTGHRDGWTGWESWNFMELMDSQADCPLLHSVTSVVFVENWTGGNDEAIPGFQPKMVQDVGHQPNEGGICFTSNYYNMWHLDTAPNGNTRSWTVDTPFPKY